MNCLRCNAKMKHYKLNKIIEVYGKEHKENAFSPKIQVSHNPNSVFVCDECGYCELSTKFCEEPDV